MSVNRDDMVDLHFLRARRELVKTVLFSSHTGFLSKGYYEQKTKQIDESPCPEQVLHPTLIPIYEALMSSVAVVLGALYK